MTSASHRFRGHCKAVVSDPTRASGFRACGFQTMDSDAWDTHLRDSHNAKTGQKPVVGSQPTRWGQQRDPQTGPLVGTGFRLRPLSTDEKALLGTQVAWRQDGAARTGEVWSLGPDPKSIWVVPDDARDDEQAVLLSSETYGGHHLFSYRLTSTRPVEQAS